MPVMYFEGASEDMIKCRLNRIYYPVTTLGYGERIGVWVQGCNRHCKGCMSPEMQPVTGIPVAVADVISKLPENIVPDGMTISGGEPFDQPQAVRMLIEWFLTRHGDDILIYTGYWLDELIAREDADIDWILSHIAALVDGPYEQSLDDGMGIRGSRNQRLHIFRHHKRYEGVAQQARVMQCIQEDTRLFLIGVLPKKGR